MTRVAVVGATGYSGGELCALLARHPSVELAAAFASPGGKGSPFGRLHPSLGGRRGPDAVPFDLGACLSARVDVAFLATPNETSAGLVPALLDAGVKVIDFSGSFRLRDASAYPAWYGFSHPAPGLLAEAVYGLPELSDGPAGEARLVANPGCYPTSVLLALAPLRRLVDFEKPVVCDSKSGVSGAGKKADLAYSFAELSGNFRAYAVAGHRHEPEMRQELGLSPDAPFSFVPHLLPVYRGILSTVHVSFVHPVSPAAVSSAYEEAFAAAPLVSVRPPGDLPELKDVAGTPRAEIGFVLLAGGKRGVLVSVIDNLLKGAASQAVQNLNRLIGLDETEGLT